MHKYGCSHRRLLAEARRHLALTPRGRRRDPGPDERIVDVAITVHCMGIGEPRTLRGHMPAHRLDPARRPLPDLDPANHRPGTDPAAPANPVTPAAHQPRTRNRGSGRYRVSHCATTEPSSPPRWSANNCAPPSPPPRVGRTTSPRTSRPRCPSNCSLTRTPTPSTTPQSQTPNPGRRPTSRHCGPEEVTHGHRSRPRDRTASRCTALPRAHPSCPGPVWRITSVRRLRTKAVVRVGLQAGDAQLSPAGRARLAHDPLVGDGGAWDGLLPCGSWPNGPARAPRRSAARTRRRSHSPRLPPPPERISLPRANCAKPTRTTARHPVQTPATPL